MKIAFFALAAMLLPAMAGAAPQKPAGPAPIQVMVLGAYHFGNPGKDVNNVTVDSVLTAKRQKELAALATALLTFRPTQVAVERESERADLHAEAYATFDPAQLSTDVNETVQIGYRIAHRAGLRHVYAIDEQPKGSEPDYFPFDKVQAAVESHRQHALIAPLLAESKSSTEAFGKALLTQTITRSLIDVNGPEFEAVDKRFYFGILGVGDQNDQAGADLNAMWFLRNAKIFGKLVQVAKPGDRIILVYGAGHGYWLRHLIRETPGFQLVDVMPFLKKVKR